VGCADLGRARRGDRMTGGVMSWRLVGGWWSRVTVLALTVIGLAWCAPVAGAATLSWSGPLAVDTGYSPEALTCISATECVTGDSDGHEVTFDPAGGAIISGPTPAVDGNRSINAIACVPFSTQCTAVDDLGRAVTFNAATGSVIAGPTSIDGTQELDAVSCLSTTECVAVDADGSRITFNASTESVSSSYRIDGTQVLYAVVCLSSTECIATDDDTQAVTFNPGSGSVIAGPRSLGFYDNVYGLACPSTTECVAVSAGGYEITFAPTTLVDTFPEALVDSDGTILHAVACPSTNECIAVGYGGTELSFNPTSGSIISAPTSIDATASNTLTSVACLSLTQCIALDEAGNEFTTTTPLTVSITGSGSGSVTGNGISCAATCSSGYYPGTSITLTAAAASGSTFAGWSGAGCSGTGTCTVSVPSAPMVTATFTANPIPPVVTPPVITPPILTSLNLGSVTVSGTTAREKLTCKTSPTGTCKVSVVLTVTEKVRHGKVIAVTASKAVKTTKRTVTIGRETLTLAVGESKTAKVALNAAGKKLLAARHKLSVRCGTAIVGGATLARHTVTFKQPKKRR
jgi:hypothetical protein